MTGIHCPKCGQKEEQPWPISVSKEQNHDHVKTCPNGHEVPIFSGRVLEFAGMPSCAY
jgi:hypothetical protein